MKNNNPKSTITRLLLPSFVIATIIVGTIFYATDKMKKSSYKFGILKDPAKSDSSKQDSGMPYQPPCESGDKKGCIMQEAYSKLKKSSKTAGYTIVWDEAFGVCGKYPNDLSILYRTKQCKLDVCMNLSLGDGNIKYNYPEKKSCKAQVMKDCPNGSIVENIPCACSISADSYVAYDKVWLEDYRNKYQFIYCCNGKKQDTPCLK